MIDKRIKKGKRMGYNAPLMRAPTYRSRAPGVSRVFSIIQTFDSQTVGSERKFNQSIDYVLTRSQDFDNLKSAYGRLKVTYFSVEIILPEVGGNAQLPVVLAVGYNH